MKPNEYPACLVPSPPVRTAGDDAREALARLARDLGYQCMTPATSYDVQALEAAIRGIIERKSRQLAGRWRRNADVAAVVEALL